jgi:hypothetical protein
MFKKMIKIGIDFSLTSPAICVYKNGEYRFISFFNDGGKDWMKSKSKSYRYHNELKEIIEIIPYTRKIDGSDYRNEQKTKMADALMIVNLIIEKLKTIIDDDVIIGLEGFSYGSISASTLDLAMYNSFLRMKLIEIFGSDCLNIVSPTEGKKMLFGKGNAKKDDMIQAFINNRPNDNELMASAFWKYCNENEIDFKQPKPIDDLVDAYGILKSI